MNIVVVILEVLSQLTGIAQLLEVLFSILRVVGVPV